MKTPDITPAQIVAIVGSLIATLTAFGVDISAAQQESLLQLVQTLAPVLLASDALIRYGRSRNKD